MSGVLAAVTVRAAERAKGLSEPSSHWRPSGRNWNKCPGSESCSGRPVRTAPKSARRESNLVAEFRGWQWRTCTHQRPASHSGIVAVTPTTAFPLSDTRRISYASRAKVLDVGQTITGDDFCRCPRAEWRGISCHTRAARSWAHPQACRPHCPR